MTQLEKIKEEVLPIDSNQELIKILFPMDIESFEECEFAYLAYIDSDKKLLLQGSLSIEIKVAQNRLGFKKELESFLVRNDCPTFTDLLFFLEVYKNHKTHGIDLEIAYKPREFNNVPMLDSYLRDTHGYIVWHYQIENLIRIFSILPDRATEIRKGLNRKDPQCWDLIKQMQFTNGVSLFDVHTERMIAPLVGTTSYPQCQEAYNLFCLLKT